MIDASQHSSEVRASCAAGIRWLLLAAALLAALPGPAAADKLKLNEMAALLVFPVITGGQPANVMSAQGDVILDTQRATTFITITNGSTENRRLMVDVISGDIGEDAWLSNSYRCFITGRETVTFVFTGAGPGKSHLHAECGSVEVENGLIVGVETDGNDLRQTTRTQNGFMVVSVALADGTQLTADVVIPNNDLLGEALIVDPEGQAYSFSALSFQGVGNNDGDKAYEFGTEYRSLPAVLVSNFLAPGPGNDVEAELILLTLDGRVGGSGTPLVTVAGNVYDDDENSQDWFYQFDCFDIVPLSEIADSFVYDPGNFNLQSPTGHFDMASFAASAGGDVHDASFAYGNGDNFRNRGVHGWIVQSVSGVLLGGDAPVSGTPPVTILDQAAWGRVLLQSNTPLAPAPGDQPALDISGAP